MHPLSLHLGSSVKAILCLTLLASNVVMASTVSNLQRIDQVSIPFVENVGQLNQPDVAFYARTFGGTLFVTKQGEWVYNLPKKTAENSTQGWSFKERLLNSDIAEINSKGLTSAKINYFRGDENNWHSDLKAYQEIAFKSVYPGITLTLNAKANSIEKIFTVAPHANPDKIKIQVEGINKIKASDQRELVLTTDIGNINFTAPIAYQMIDGEKSYVEVAYHIQDKAYGFKMGEYDHSKELIIDPLLASTFIGRDDSSVNSGYETIHAVEKQGDFVFVAGVTGASNFPAQLGFSDEHNGGSTDGFISKFSSDLSTLVAATYIGGSSSEKISSLSIDDAGNVYVLGSTISQDFPLIDGSYKYNPDVSTGTFVAKLNNDLNALTATAIPAAKSYPRKIAIANNSVYILGRINSPTIPVSADAYIDTCGRDDLCEPDGGKGGPRTFGYIERLPMDLTSVLSATYLNTGGNDFAVGSNSNVYVLASENVHNSGILSLTEDLSTKLGDISYSGSNHFSAIAVSDAAVVAVGSSRSTSLPVTFNAYDSDCGTDGLCNPRGSTNYLTADVFLGKYSLDLLTTEALTYFGGPGTELANDIEIDSADNIIILGSVFAEDLPVSDNAFDSSFNGGMDAFISKFDSDLSTLIYSSYIGGMESDVANALSTSTAGEVYIAGSTKSFNFPTTSGAFDSTFNGGNGEAFLSLFDTEGTASNGGDSSTPGSDDSDGSAEDEVIINEAPIAHAGNEQSVLPRTRVYLDASQSHDPEGSDLSYRWQQVSGKSVRLNNERSEVAHFRAPRVKNNRTKRLVFELTVTDDLGESSNEQISVTVSR